MAPSTVLRRAADQLEAVAESLQDRAEETVDLAGKLRALALRMGGGPPAPRGVAALAPVVRIPMDLSRWPGDSSVGWPSGRVDVVGAGVAALAICEALALTLIEGAVLDADDLDSALDDALTAQRNAAVPPTEEQVFNRAGALIEGVCQSLNAARQGRRGEEQG